MILKANTYSSMTYWVLHRSRSHIFINSYYWSVHQNAHLASDFGLMKISFSSLWNSDSNRSGVWSADI